MTESQGVCVLGGPSSGKSTYLGAVASAVEDQDTRLFRMGELPDDVSGLARLQDPLLEGRYPQRTQSGEKAELRMVLEARAPLPDATVEVSIIDYAGETVERLFRDRTRGWTSEWQVRASSAGVLVFLRPPAVQALPRLKRAPARGIPQGSEIARVFGDDTLAPDESPSAPPTAVTDPVRMPTELAIIELLQFLRYVRGLAPGERPRPDDWRIGVMVAAWDDVSDDWRKQGPKAYLQQEFSLLEDFLWSNFHSAGVRRFGLSATGGDLEDKGYRQGYVDGEATGFVTWNAAGRVREATDLALPLAWALFGDRAFRGLGEP